MSIFPDHTALVIGPEAEQELDKLSARLDVPQGALEKRQLEFLQAKSVGQVGSFEVLSDVFQDGSMLILHSPGVGLPHTPH